MKTSGLATRGIIIATLLGATGAGVLWAMPAKVTLSPPTEPVLQAARDLGFQPTALAASGCTVGEAQALLVKFAAEEEKLAALVSARNEVSRLMARGQNLRRGVGVVENAREELAAAVSSLHDAEVELATARSALRQAVEPELSGAVRSKLALWESCHATGLTADLRVVAWTSEQRSELKAALAAERIALSRRQTLDSASVSVLEAARSHTDAVAARSSLQTNLEAIKSAFTAEVTR